MTVRENEIRIENVEDEVSGLDKRVTRLETDFTVLVSKLDLLIKMGRLIVGMVAAANTPPAADCRKCRRVGVVAIVLFRSCCGVMANYSRTAVRLQRRPVGLAQDGRCR